jgi:hypothetical protein
LISSLTNLQQLQNRTGSRQCRSSCRRDKMRVISQNGTIDVPYDYFSLSIASGKYEDVEVAYIYCHNLSSPNGTKLAEYSSREKALKAMEMLRNRYMSLEIIKMVASGASEYMDKTMQQEELQSVIGKFWDTTVFRFPADDEVKV